MPGAEGRDDGLPASGWKARLPLLAAALWWGSLTTVGFVVVPVLFAHAASPAQAGQLAARLFTAQTWIGMGCGFVLLLAARVPDSREGVSLEWGRGALVYVVLGLLLGLLQEFAVAPRIVARQSLPLWHSIGTAAYAAQWMCALVVLLKLTPGHSRAGGNPRLPD